MSRLTNGIATIRDCWEGVCGYDTRPSSYPDETIYPDNRCIINYDELLELCEVKIIDESVDNYQINQAIKYEDLECIKIEPQYLCFTALDEVSKVSLTNNNGNVPILYYSFDTTNWEQWDYSQIELQPGDNVYMYGDNETGFNTSDIKFSYFQMSGKISASGNIQSLLSIDIPDTIPCDYCYYKMFNGSGGIGLIDVESLQLPVKTLKPHCYHYMFNVCDNLINTPVLPATTLAERCYEQMFNGCISLVNAPELPATTLADYCYNGMFNGCTSLVEAPVLPAGKIDNNDTQIGLLAQGCYYGMFMNCYGLEIAPELPAMALANGCYHSMFTNCTSLVTAPVLPATTLAKSCYAWMFSGCIGLMKMEVGFTEWRDDIYATSEWVKNVNTYGGTFIKPDELKWENGINRMPIYWFDTEIENFLCLTNIGETTASVSLYRSIGNNCKIYYCKDGEIIGEIAYGTNKTNIEPGESIYLFGYNNKLSGSYFKMSGEISASGNIMSIINPNCPDAIPSYDCFSRLFFNCDSLVNAGDLLLPATTLVNSCYHQMFQGCTSLVVAPALPATTLAPYCYTYMFRGCTSLVTAPELPATTLAQSCYYFMHYGTNVLPDCTNIDFESEEVVQSGGLRGLFAGTKVTDADLMGILPINPETGKYWLPVTNLSDNCYESMFHGCTSLVTAPELPATELGYYNSNGIFESAYSCYENMFSYCTSLVTAPALPATTLAESCYSNMFSRCSSLEQAPALPATELGYYDSDNEFNTANYCYQEMFYNCTSLVNVSTLPATTLADGCYSSMFSRCSSLEQAPALPAITLTSECYSNMFEDCNSLMQMEVGFTEWRDDINATESWVQGVETYGGTFIKPDELEEEYHENRIPINWLNIDWDDMLCFTNVGNEKAAISIVNTNNYPDLYYRIGNTGGQWDYNILQIEPGDKVWIYGENKDGFYIDYTHHSNFDVQGEFSVSGNIMSLISHTCPNEIPCEWCFCELFYECEGLVSAENLRLPATELSNECYMNMFYGCSNLVTAPELPATTLADWCYISMFNGCSSLVTAPALPATTLKECCYTDMFRDCTSLVTAPELPATELGYYNNDGEFIYVTECYYGMFHGCKKLQTAPALPATKLTGSCYGEMFSGCTSLVNAPALPATELEEYCYGSMFSGCTSLVNAPALPATTLSDYCYEDMFNGCINLMRMEVSFTEWRDDINATETWVQGVETYGGTFIKPSDLEEDYGNWRIPINWGPICLVEDTLITLSDNTVKPIQQLTYNDNILTLNHITGELETHKPLWLMKPITTNKIVVITLENGTIIKTNAPEGESHCHRFYSPETNRYENADMLIGKSIKTIDGESKIVSMEIVNEENTLYNLITDNNLNYFANGVLSASGFANSLTMTDNGYVFDGIDDKYINGLQLKHSNEPIDRINAYINKLEKFKKV